MSNTLTKRHAMEPTLDQKSNGVTLVTLVGHSSEDVQSENYHLSCGDEYQGSPIPMRTRPSSLRLPRHNVAMMEDDRHDRNGPTRDETSRTPRRSQSCRYPRRRRDHKLADTESLSGQKSSKLRSRSCSSSLKSPVPRQKLFLPRNHSEVSTSF